MKKQYQNILSKISKEENSTIKPSFKVHDRVLIIDGLNMFFRNFAMVNFVNPTGNHIGGLGGFLKSLGAMITLIKPTSVYVIFDGPGSSTNRKNILPEYKAGRNTTRMTNWDVFENHEEENDAKIDQITRLIHYLRCLPVKTISMPKVEADDIIAFLGGHLTYNTDNKVYIVSQDKDFIQLINNQIIVYRPVEKQFYNIEQVITKFGVLPSNFLLYKMLMGDSSDKISKVKGLGEKGILKKFPELKTQELEIDDLFEIAAGKFKDHIIYSRILMERANLEKNHKVMDLKHPLVNEVEMEVLRELTQQPVPEFKKADFINLYAEDGLGQTIRNVDYWLKENFSTLSSFK